MRINIDTLGKGIKYCIDKDYRFLINAYKGKYNDMSDEEYLKHLYKASIGKELNLSNPVTYNEKIQWLKLYDHNPLYTALVDKYEVKKYVASVIGDQYIIPTIGAWDSVEEIEWDKLPEKFVLKVTHDSGGLVICKDKAQLDKKKAIARLRKSLKNDYYLEHREWPYKDVKRRIIAEQYMEDLRTHELRDYKFLCFDGEPKVMFVATDRQNENEETKFDFFDMEYNHLEVKNGHDNSVNLPDKPYNFEEMKNLARKLSKNLAHVRVDFYEVNKQLYFGEMTFFHFSGLVPFEPEKWDYKFGEWLKLPIQDK